MSDPGARLRLDDALVARGLVPSRARAKDAIARGCVLVDGGPARKAGQRVGPEARIAVQDEAQGYVARSALKLIAALDQFGIDVGERRALDVGASTGGFTQTLLQRGAAHIIALDVGHSQLHDSLRNDPRVTVLEGMNAREVLEDDLPFRPDLVTIDVSFIAQSLILPAVTSVAAPDATLITLVKPQFELGPEAVGKGGLVTDLAMQARAVRGVSDELDRLGWRCAQPLESPITGTKGNQEFLLAAWKDS